MAPPPICPPPPPPPPPPAPSLAVVDAERVELVEDLHAAQPTFAFPNKNTKPTSTALEYGAPPSLSHLCLMLRFLRFKLWDLDQHAHDHVFVGDDDPGPYHDDSRMLAESTLWMLTAHVQARDRWEEVYELKLKIEEKQGKMRLEEKEAGGIQEATVGGPGSEKSINQILKRIADERKALKEENRVMNELLFEVLVEDKSSRHNRRLVDLLELAAGAEAKPTPFARELEKQPTVQRRLGEVREAREKGGGRNNSRNRRRLNKPSVLECA